MSLLPPQTESSTPLRRSATLAVANCLLILAVAIAMRGWGLDHLPGVNGDEAWMGVQSQRFLDGEQAVTWTTPTGNPVNPFLFWPTVLLHAWLPASIGLLRLPAMLSGVLALAVNYGLCRRAFESRLAAISTLLLAVLPINIAYSRFGWDASQSLLATLPVLYLSLIATQRPDRRRTWLLWALAAQAAAVLVHPTNVFVAPMLIIGASWCYRSEIRQRLCQAKESRYATLLAVLLALVAAAAVWLLWPWCTLAARRIVAPGELGTFLVRWLDLLSGLTVFQFIPGSLIDTAAPVAIAYRAVTGAVLGLALWGAYRRWQETRSATIGLLFVGDLASLIGFFLIAGPEAMRPHFERYAICLIGGSALVIAIGVEWWIANAAVRLSQLARHAAPAAAWSLLVAFGWFYLSHFAQTGGSSHDTFRTADIDPKQAAILEIVDQAGSDEQPETLIITADWWNYWPLAYLTHGQEHVTVCMSGNVSNTALPVTEPRRGRVYWVGFYGGDPEQRWKERCQASGFAIHESHYNDYARRAVVSVIEAHP